MAFGTVPIYFGRGVVSSGLDPNHLDRNRVTSYVYDEVGNVTKQVAHLPDGTGESVQVTDYVYGVSTGDTVASQLDSNDLLHRTSIPKGRVRRRRRSGP